MIRDINKGLERPFLLIAYHFPPSAAVGGTRLANFAQRLPLFGWKPYVLTIRDENIENLDLDRLRDVEDVAIQKTRVLPTLIAMYAVAKKRFFGFRRNASSEPSGIPVSGLGTTRRESLTQKLKRYLLSFLLLPDNERGWILPASLAAIRCVRRQRVEWIMTSCPPYSTHLIGLAVKLFTGVKWVADFRDPWMTADPKRNCTCLLSVWIESWLEKKVIENADLTLFNVERLKNAYRERYAHVPGKKFVFIPNGITPRALEDADPVMKFENFTLSYTGSLYVGRSPEPVFQAVSQLIQEGRTTPKAVRINLVGHCRTVEGVPIDRLIQKYGLESSVEVHDSLPYSDALKIIRRSHIALLFAPNLPFQIPAKVYDYLGTGSSILAIAEEGASADLIRQTRAGESFAPEDIKGIKRFIWEEMTSRESKNRDYSNALARFDIRRITEDLARNLEWVGNQGAPDAHGS